MKVQPAVRTDEDDSKAIKEGKQDSSVADVTSTNSHVDTPNCDEKSVTVQITMSTLPADEVEVCIILVSSNCLSVPIQKIVITHFLF